MATHAAVPCSRRPSIAIDYGVKRLEIKVGHSDSKLGRSWVQIGNLGFCNYNGFVTRRRRRGVIIVAESGANAGSGSWEKTRPRLSDVVWPAAGAFVAMTIMGVVDKVIACKGLTFTIAPFGAVCTVLFAVPTSPAARKYNIFVSHIGCAALGVMSLAVFGPGWIARSIALAASVAFMIYTDSLHPPGVLGIASYCLRAARSPQDLGLGSVAQILAFMLPSSIFSLIVDNTVEHFFSCWFADSLYRWSQVSPSSMVVLHISRGCRLHSIVYDARGGQFPEKQLQILMDLMSIQYLIRVFSRCQHGACLCLYIKKYPAMIKLCADKVTDHVVLDSSERK